MTSSSTTSSSLAFHIVIPARYQASRFPGKLLQEIQGISVLNRVFNQAVLANPSSITIATDDVTIYNHAKLFCKSVIMTSAAHQSGTDRIAEVVQNEYFSPNNIIVNVQGDEPFIPPALIRQVAQNLNENADEQVATLCFPLRNTEELTNSNIVKVVCNKHNQALYFSRSPIPFNRSNPSNIEGIYRHIGLYAYRVKFLLDFVSWPMAPLEQMESLEQLRILWQGYSIHIDECITEPFQDINTYEDLLLAQKLVNSFSSIEHEIESR